MSSRKTFCSKRKPVLVLFRIEVSAVDVKNITALIDNTEEPGCSKVLLHCMLTSGMKWLKDAAELAFGKDVTLRKACLAMVRTEVLHK